MEIRSNQDNEAGTTDRVGTLKFEKAMVVRIWWCNINDVESMKDHERTPDSGREYLRVLGVNEGINFIVSVDSY